MDWPKDLVEISGWVLRQQDLRHKYLYAKTAATIMKTPGLSKALEATVILTIYEAALGKGYRENETVGYEVPYPPSSSIVQKSNGNPKRADLAFKKHGAGQNWGYVEVKRYGLSGKSWVQHDIDKLKLIKKKSQRWMLIYRIRPRAGKSQSLKSLLAKNFRGQLKIHGGGSFETVEDSKGGEGICEYVLARVI